MIAIYLDLLFITCLWLIFLGMTKPERIYQFPFYMGAIFVSFILPQAVSLVYKPGVVTPSGLQNVLIVSSLCAAMCWIGFSLKANNKLIRKLEFCLDEKKLLNAGIITAIGGSACQFFTLILPAQYAGNGGWTGPITIVYFFGQFYYIGLAILLQSFIRKITLSKAILIAITLTPVLFRIIVNGRRSPTAGLLIIFGATLFFERKILPPRWLVIALVFLGIFLIPLFGIMRFGFWESLVTGNLTISDLKLGLDYLLAGKNLELRNAAVVIEYVNNFNVYGYGSGYWNSIVFQFIPAQIFGKEFKDSLYLQISDLSSSFNLKKALSYELGYQMPNGSTLTGIGDSFIEFGYFGCLVFALLGYLFKNLWVSSTYYRNSFSRIIYVSIISSTHWMVTHSTYTFFASNLVFQSLCFILIIFYAKSKRCS